MSPAPFPAYPQLRLMPRALLGAAACLLAVDARAQAASVAGAERTVRPFLEVRTGYTSGRYEHYTNDYTSAPFNLFATRRENPDLGPLVRHRFAGGMLGISYGRETAWPDRGSKLHLLAGLDVLVAPDRLTYADGRRTTVPLVAAHPHAEIGFKTSRWLVRGKVGALVGRVGYFATQTSKGFLAGQTTVVDTVALVPDATIRLGWSNWILLDVGNGAAGLLGLANPVLHTGLGTGFGPRSPVALLVGTTEAGSHNPDSQATHYYFLQAEAQPANAPWRASGFFTFGDGSYGRGALQFSYRIGL